MLFSSKNKMQAIIGSQFPKVVIPKIDEAKSSISLIVFDWRWYPNDPGNPVQLFNQALVRAVRRGVAVKAVANFGDIVKTLKAVGVQAKKLETKNLVHAKMIVIDEKLVIVGSHNITTPAFTTNYEVSTMFESEEAAKEYTNFFNNLWQ